MTPIWERLFLWSLVGMSPSLIASWMRSLGYMNIDAAIEEIRQQLPDIDSSTILLSSVKEYLQ